MGDKARSTSDSRLRAGGGCSRRSCGVSGDGKRSMKTARDMQLCYSFTVVTEGSMAMLGEYCKD